MFLQFIHCRYDWKRGPFVQSYRRYPSAYGYAVCPKSLPNAKSLPKEEGKSSGKIHIFQCLQTITPPSRLRNLSETQNNNKLALL